ncbi:hypothetical protein [Flavobacterium sp.]|uniref:hypothetical protein n=1 Tax=Flavobacterium sp. TaxID=239 RepID=UPI003BCA3F80
MKKNERHVCLSSWIILMIIINSVTSMVYIFGNIIILENIRFSISKQWMLIIGILSISNINFAANLWKINKWSFWAFGISTLIVLCINVFLELGLFKSLIGTIGVIFIHGILQIKYNSNNSGLDCLK